MAPKLEVNASPSYSMMTTTRLPGVLQDVQSSRTSRHHSKLELIKSEFQQKVLKEKEEKLVTMYNQQQEAALNKIRNHHYYPQYQSTSTQSQTETSPLSSAASHRGNRSYLSNEVRTSPAALPAKKSVGIDRACPLKPVYCRKASSLNNIFNNGDGKDQRTTEYNNMLTRPSQACDQNKRWPSGLKNTKNPPPSPASSVQTKRSASNHGIMEQLWLQQQAEQEEKNLEMEIRRKEAILKEKLRRTEAELRWIQREREQANRDDRKERERKGKRGKAAEKEQEATLKRETMHAPSQDNFFDYRGYEDNQDVRNGGGARGNASRRNASECYSSMSNTSSYVCEYNTHVAVGKVRKETLLASNNKIRERESSHSIKATEKMWKLEESGSSFSSTRTQPSPFSYPNSDVRRDESSSQRSHKSVIQEFAEASSDDDDGYKDKEEFPDQDFLSSALAQCSFCGRKFVVDRLERHMKICNKAQNSKRKVFDSSTARAKGTDLEKYISRKKHYTEQEEQPKKNVWRQKHESFMRMLKQARDIQGKIKQGEKLSNLPPPPPDENPDYICCPHCSRRFAPKVAERHIPKCETIKSRPPPPPRKQK
ncbi:zinc finger C2HC domain-containing protein 1C [Protopterus annectens]|uniref:zinc finger C2HC domain-containing protein 1C n=1 Tax=Protopterus annectens TaxID=7888 RepID=UPI001CFA72C1|nr:zinc finger C2HC domain-containing protein 1C [Protopterus annectens]